MTHKRKAHAAGAYMAVEKILIRHLDLDQFVAEFNTSSRHIVL